MASAARTGCEPVVSISRVGGDGSELGGVGPGVSGLEVDEYRGTVGLVA